MQDLKRVQRPPGRTSISKLKQAIYAYCDTRTQTVCFPKPEDLDWDEYCTVTEHRRMQFAEEQEQKLQDIFDSIKEVFIEKLKVTLSQQQVLELWECVAIESWETNPSKILSRIIGIVVDWDEAIKNERRTEQI